jgi:hypothetical protein
MAVAQVDGAVLAAAAAGGGGGGRRMGWTWSRTCRAVVEKVVAVAIFPRWRSDGECTAAAVLEG